MNSEKLLIVGCGDLGQRLARRLQTTGMAVTGLRRHPPAEPSPGLDWYAGDARDPACLDGLLGQGFDDILITLTPDERSDAGYERGYIEPCQQLLAALARTGQRPRRLLFVSSTSVYAQDKGEWVDEDSPALPVNFNGRRLLEAEQLLMASGQAVTRVRFSGIYGPGRMRLLEQLRSGRARVTDAFTNRIHAEDCAGFLAHLIAMGRAGQPLADLYLASDSAPVSSRTLMGWLAQTLGLPMPAEDPNHNPGSAHRRCSNRRMLDTGYCLQYPDYRAGYGALLASC